MTDAAPRERICTVGASLFRRGLTFGATGNISMGYPDGGWLMTPTNASMGELDPARLSRIDKSGAALSGDKPTKEAFLHQVSIAAARRRRRWCTRIPPTRWPYPVRTDWTAVIACRR